MLKKLKAFYDVFRKGQVVTNAEAWKTGQITGGVVAGFILAVCNIASLFGHDLPIDLATANTLGIGIVTVANGLLTLATSKKVGLPAAVEPNDLPVAGLQPTDPTSAPVSYAGVPKNDAEADELLRRIREIPRSGDPTSFPG